MTPDIKFPDIISKIGNMEGGCYWMEYNGGMSQSTRNWFDLRKVYHLDLSDIDNVTNHDEASALVRDVMNMGGGNKLRLKFWFTNVTLDGNVVNGLTFKSIILKNGVESGTPAGYNTAFLPPGGNGGTGGGYHHCTEALVKQYGVKLCLMTEYQYSVTYGSSCIPGVTPADRVQLWVFAPYASSTTPGTVKSWVQVTNDVKLNANVKYELDSPSNLYYPDITPNSPATSVAGIGYAFLYGSMTDMKNAWELDSDDFYKIGEKDNIPQEDDPSEPGGGDGSYDDTSDPVDFPGLPTGGALSSGAIKAFLVSSGSMTQIFTKLWNTGIFDIETWQKLMETPLDSLIQLECLPFIPSYGENAAIKLGNFDTEVNAPVITSQYKTIDCGSIKVQKYWGSALDYSCTNTEIYLPFIGIKRLLPDDVIDTTIHVKYNIDILTGDLTAQIKCGQSVLYKFTGNCKATVPVSARVSEALENLIKGATTMAMGVAAGGTAGLAATAISTAVNVAMSKTRVDRSGDISGSISLLDDFVPYMIIHRPQQSLAADFKNQKGYPSNISAVLNTLSGYTEVEYIHLTGIDGATDTELNEIETLLKKGVIL